MTRFGERGKRTIAALTASLALLAAPLAAAAVGTAIAAEPTATLKLRLTVVNPKDDKTQSKVIKTYLPRELQEKDVVDAGGLEVKYDQDKGQFYVTRDVVLEPSEVKTFEVVVNDVWAVPPPKLEEPRKLTERILEHFKDTTFYEQANFIAVSIYTRLDQILAKQNDQTVSREQHIAFYRENIGVLDTVQADIDRLQKLLVTAGGPPNLDLIEESDAALKNPTSKTTWVLIFIILIFIAILGGAFYFTWQGQAKVTENIFSREKELTFPDVKNEQPKKTG